MIINLPVKKAMKNPIANLIRSAVILLMASLLLLSACGQTGPLYLPDANATPEQSEQKEDEVTD